MTPELLGQKVTLPKGWTTTIDTNEYGTYQRITDKEGNLKLACADTEASSINKFQDITASMYKQMCDEFINDNDYKAFTSTIDEDEKWFMYQAYIDMNEGDRQVLSVYANKDDNKLYEIVEVNPDLDTQNLKHKVISKLTQ